MSHATATHTPTTHTPRDAAARPPRVWTVGLASGIVAAVATSSVAALTAAIGDEIAIAGEPIPVGGFAVLTLIGAVLGVGLAALARRARRPRATFVSVTAALTALSIVPDVVADTSRVSRLVLAATHVVAAAIIVPAIARRLAA